MYCILGRRTTCIFLKNINCVKSGATSYCWQMWELSMRCQYYVLFVNLQPHYIPTIVISFAISYFEYNVLGICFKCKSSNISRITDTWTEWNILEKITRFIFDKTKTKKFPKGVIADFLWWYVEHCLWDKYFSWFSCYKQIEQMLRKGNNEFGNLGNLYCQ